MPRPVEIICEVEGRGEGVTRRAARFISGALQEAIASRGMARLAISGGNTPKAVFELLSDPDAEFSGSIAWEKVQLFWVDERCVGPDDPESNFGMTKRALLDRVPLPPANVYRMEGELEPEEAASRYESEIRNAFLLEGAETPTFDLVMLGMGDDGHTASLFPHTEGLNEMARLVIANHVPQKDTWRITLTWPVINAARQVAFLIEGKAKAPVVKTVFAGVYDPETYPSQLIRPLSGRLTLLLDEGAASQLPLKEEGGVKKVSLG